MVRFSALVMLLVCGCGAIDPAEPTGAVTVVVAGVDGAEVSEVLILPSVDLRPGALVGIFPSSRRLPVQERLEVTGKRFCAQVWAYDAPAHTRSYSGGCCVDISAGGEATCSSRLEENPPVQETPLHLVDTSTGEDLGQWSEPWSGFSSTLKMMVNYVPRTRVYYQSVDCNFEEGPRGNVFVAQKDGEPSWSPSVPFVSPEGRLYVNVKLVTVQPGSYTEIGPDGSWRCSRDDLVGAPWMVAYWVGLVSDQVIQPRDPQNLVVMER